MDKGFKGLIKFYEQLGWYVGTHDLITLTLEGGFEAFRGKASETWETRYKLHCKKIKCENKIIPEINLISDVYETLDELANKALIILKK